MHRSPDRNGTDPTDGFRSLPGPQDPNQIGTLSEQYRRSVTANEPPQGVLQDSQNLHCSRGGVSPVTPESPVRPTSPVSPVRHYSEEFWNAVVAKADGYPLPLVAEVFLHPGIRHLIQICAVLQANAASDPFFLSSYVAGKLLQVNQRQAHRWLRLLCRRRLLSLVKKGNRALANEYLYHP
jgi:hypothetical protein